jgi:hypothetical protein
MNQRQDNSAADARGFCTFCMGAFEPARIGTHVRRCRDRVLDAGEIQLDGQEHPMAFILMLGIPVLADFWLCLEAHVEARVSDLDRFIRRTWFPNSVTPGGFALGKPKRASGKPAPPSLESHVRIGKALAVKNRFTYRVTHGRTVVEVQIDVAGLLPTAIMHRPIDVVAFPLNQFVPRGSGPAWEPAPFLA